jgi:hypothetical protein
VNDENCNVLADSHNILSKWKNYCSQILNLHNVSDVREKELLVTGSSRLEAEIAIAKLRKYKSPGSDQILAEVIRAGHETLLSVIHKLINYICNKKALPYQ